MVLGDSAETTGLDLVQRIERQIAEWTWGRIQRLRVEMTTDRVIVHGCTASYYLAQLVVAAVREVVPSAPLDLAIQVMNSAGSAAPRTPRAPDR